jgi:hypothetical protein
MNYQKVYDSLMERAVGRTVAGYVEKHHINPRCLGGDDTADNIVELTYREHFIAHWLLYRLHPTHKGLSFAFTMMANKNSNPKLKRDYTLSSRVLEEARIASSEANKGDNNPMRNPVIAAKVSAALKGRSNSRKGIPKSPEHRAKLSKVLSGKGRSRFLIQYDLEWNELKQWVNSRVVQKELGYFFTNICNAAAGKSSKSRPHYAYGYMWKYNKQK